MNKFHRKEPVVSYKWKHLESFHPLKTLILVALIGISILFFTTLFAFALSRPHELAQEKYGFPRSFFLSTIIILISSYFINQIKLCYVNDHVKQILRNASVALLLVFLFCVLQIMGWKQLYDTGVFLKGKPNGAFLYVLTALHLVHLFGAILFCSVLIFKTFQIQKNEAKRILYFSNKLEKARIETLVLYWHFLDALWIMLFLYFLWCFVK